MPGKVGLHCTHRIPFSASASPFSVTASERVASAAEFFVKVNHVPKVILDFFETSTAAAEDKSVRFSLQELEPKDEKEVNVIRKKGPSLR